MLFFFFHIAVDQHNQLQSKLSIHLKIKEKTIIWWTADLRFNLVIEHRKVDKKIILFYQLVVQIFVYSIFSILLETCHWKIFQKQSHFLHAGKSEAASHKSAELF